MTEKLERAEAPRFGKTKAPRKSLGGTDTLLSLFLRRNAVVPKRERVVARMVSQ